MLIESVTGPFWEGNRYVLFDVRQKRKVIYA
jgi:hypothetical protein